MGSGLTAFGGYIRYLGNGGLWFRPYGGSLSKSAKVTKALLPHHSVPSPRLGMPERRHCPRAAAKGHPWPSAANPASMPGCPLRNTFVQPAWLTGRRDQHPPRGGLIADLVLGGTAFPLVGASLLAMAVCQSLVMLNVPASSRASSLPQGVVNTSPSPELQPPAITHQAAGHDQACHGWQSLDRWSLRLLQAFPAQP